MSGSLKALSISLMKIVGDLRLMASGPRTGLNELILPSLQPGSSIMPGKVNPVIAESILQVCARVIGNDVTIDIAASSGTLELNVMMPLMAHVMMESITLLKNSISMLINKMLKGISANERTLRENVEKSLALVTSLVPELGYEKGFGYCNSGLQSKQNHQGDID